MVVIGRLYNELCLIHISIVEVHYVTSNTFSDEQYHSLFQQFRDQFSLIVIHTIYENAVCFFPRRYNDACMVKRPYGTFHFREVDSFKKSTDNKTHKYMSENTLM